MVKQTYMQTKKPNQERPYPETLKNDVTHYPEIIYDNYINHLEQNGFINKDGTMKNKNEQGQQIPTLQEYTENLHTQQEIKQQLNYELQNDTTRDQRPTIEKTKW